jgi:hypothetical protein
VVEDREMGEFMFFKQVFFKRRPRPPLSDAADLVDRAVRLVHGYWRDRSFQPREKDLRAFQELERRLFLAAATARRIAIRMERRLAGEPEIKDWRR